jgi:hypothetical protein
MGFGYIKSKQKKWQKKWRLEEELRLKEEEERIAKMEAEAREREERAYQKRRLLEEQENERLRLKRIEEKKVIAKEKWDNQRGTLVAQVKERTRINNTLEEIKVIIGKRDPSLQVLDWTNWLLSDPLNQRLADLDLEIAMALFKRDNLLAKRRRGTRGKKAADKPYVLTFTGDTATDARFDYVSTTFNPDSYDGAGTGLNRGFTVSYWVKSLEDVSDSPDVYIAWGKRSQANGAFQFGVKNANKIKIGVGSGDKDDNTHKEGLGWEPGDDNVAHGANDGEWHHWVVTYGGDDHSSIGGDRQVRVWMDGVEILKNGASGGGMGIANWVPGWQNCDEGCDDAANDASNIYFGGRANFNGLDDDPPTSYNQGWACSLSEVAIYNVEKDEDGTFAREVYNAGWGYNHSGNSGLVGYWKFNEGSGTTVTDYGPYGKHGTLTSDADQGGSGIPTWTKNSSYE